VYGGANCRYVTNYSIAVSRFDVHTKQHPNVKFDLTTFEAVVSIREISRQLIGENTVIRFELSLTNTRPAQITLRPIDNGLEPLVVPVTFAKAHESHVREGILPNRLAIGLIAPNEHKAITIFGEADVLESIQVADQKSLPHGITIEVGSMYEGRRAIQIVASSDAVSGLFNDSVLLLSKDGREFPIQIMGMVK
jgi:hypothetical protein